MIGCIIIVIIGFLVILFFLNISKPVKKEKEEIVSSEIKLVPKLTEHYLTLSNYIGQRKKIKYLKGHITLAKLNDAPLPHILLWGNGGLGKSTLMKAVAHEIGGRFIEIVPANLRNIKDLFSRFFLKVCYQCGFANPFSANTCLKCRNKIGVYFMPILQLMEKDVIFLEECHGLKVDIEEALYSLLQDGYMMLRYNGRDQMVEFPPITIAGATTRVGDLNKPFKDRFKIEIHLDPYPINDLMLIGKMYCNNKGIMITEEPLQVIAEYSFGIPRIVKKYIDDCQTIDNTITINTIKNLSDLLDIDENGLDKIHRKILDYIHIRGQAGSSAIAGSVGISTEIFQEVYEPALSLKEFIWQGNRGRILTLKALNIYYPECNCKNCKKIKENNT